MQRNKFSFRKWFKVVKDYNKIAETHEIARRYFVMNTFDGVLTILGILVASYIAGFYETKIIVTTSFAAAVAIGISGFYGAYLTENAERVGAIKNLEKRVSMWLKGTQIESAQRFATFELALIDGLSPLISSTIMLIPFLIKLPVETAYYISFAISFGLLCLLGGFLGKISKKSVFSGALKMVMAGIVCTLVLYLLGQ